MSVDRDRDYPTVEDAQRTAERFAADLGHVLGGWGPAVVYRPFIFSRAACVCRASARITAYQIGLDWTPHYTCDGQATRARCPSRPPATPAGQRSFVGGAS